MKKSYVIFALIFAILFSGCSLAPQNETVLDAKYQEFWKNGDYVDDDKEHLPTDADMKKIETNMSIIEVVNILGRPHYIPPTSGPVYYLEWFTEEGNLWVLWIVVSDNLDATEGSRLDKHMNYGFVYYIVAPDTKDSTVYSNKN